MARPSQRRTAMELADVLQENGFTAEQAEAAEPYLWAWVGETAGHDETPDEEMQGRTIRLLRSRAANPDPFAAFQGADR